MTQPDDLQQAISIHKLCGVCFTDSWRPCPEGTPDAVKSAGGWMVCGTCRLESEVERLRAENRRLRAWIDRLRRMQLITVTKELEEYLDGKGE